MKNLFIIIFIILFHTTILYSQNKYGKVSTQLLEQTSYNRDTTASALITLKESETIFSINRNNKFQFEQEIKVQIKILKKEGLDWCNQSIGYYFESNYNREEIRGLSGCTYNLENGKIIKSNLSKNNIFEEDSGTNFRLCKFTMPAAKVGSVIEYKFTIVSGFLQDLREFNFQESIPIEEVSYNIRIPEYLNYNINMLGYESVETKRKDINGNLFFEDAKSLQCSMKEIDFFRKNMPAIKNEEYVWTMSDYLSKVSFELQSVHVPGNIIQTFSSNWSSIDQNLLKSDYYGGNLKKKNIFKNEIDKGELTIERAIDIQNMIKSKVTWNGKNSSYPTNLSKVYNEGTGNSADLNLLLYNALKAGGYNVYPVLLSTRKNGVLPVANPSASSFNYLIVALDIDTMRYYTDASAKYGDWNILPNMVQVPQARIVSDEFKGWVDLSNITPYRSTLMSITTLSDNTQNSKISESNQGMSAYNLRATYNSAENETKFIEELEKYYGGEISDFIIKNSEETYKPLTLGFTLNKFESLEDEYLYIDALPQKIVSDNPFKNETRTYPVMFDNITYKRYGANFNIPDGYEVEELPKSEHITVNINDMSLLYKTNIMGNQIQILAIFQINKILFLPGEYDLLRDFYTKLVQKSNEQIVLKKKNKG